MTQQAKSYLVLDCKTRMKIATDEIIMLEGDKNYTRFSFRCQRGYMSSHTLKYFETQLLEKGFVRIHRSYLVNNLYIQSTNLDDMSVSLTNGLKLTLARRRKKAIK